MACRRASSSTGAGARSTGSAATAIAHQFAQQREWVDKYWLNADVEVEGEPELQQAIRWNLFQIAQASARADQLGVPAKGVTGSGYEGHCFWDTEIYVVPFLAYTFPVAAKNLLRFRVNLLDRARERARELAQRGALFPWRTINGLEASAYYAAGTAQYHIDADIAYAVARYCDATGDTAFQRRDGVEILVETARMWADLGFWRVDGSRTFHIHGVTGPDEYTTVVNNNLFTNVMARFNLERAAAAVRELREADPTAYARFSSRLRLQEGEVEEWEECAANMAIPFDEGLGIHPQDQNFLDRELWDLSATPAEKRPLLLNYHPLVIYRFQVLKQADVVLAMLLQGNRFTLEEKRRELRVLRPDHHGRLLAQRGRAVDHRRRGGSPPDGDALLPPGAVRRPGRPAPQHHRRRAHRLGRRGVERPRLRLRGDARPRRRADLRPAAAGGVAPPDLPDAAAGQPDPHRRRAGGDHVHAPRRRAGRVSPCGGRRTTSGRDAPVRVPLDGQGPRLTHIVPREPSPIVRSDGTVVTAGVPTDFDLIEEEQAV